MKKRTKVYSSVVVALLCFGLVGCRKVPSKIIFQAKDYVRVLKRGVGSMKIMHVFVPKGKTLKKSTKYIQFMETDYKLGKAKMKIAFKRMKQFIKVRLRTAPHKDNDKRYCTVRTVLGKKRLIKFIIFINAKNFHILEYQKLLKGDEANEDKETLCDNDTGDFTDLEALASRYFG